MKLPSRWLQYSNCKRINGTRFVAFKVPLREGFNRSLTAENRFDYQESFAGVLLHALRQEGRNCIATDEISATFLLHFCTTTFISQLTENSAFFFTPSDLLLNYPVIQLVIDLTFTHKYYDGHLEFTSKSIQYVKIACKGHKIPSSDVYKRFCDSVDAFLQNSPEDAYIGVHCTHGVNRTGYLVVRYMIERLGFSPREALTVFETSRGHAIEREEYVDDLNQCVPAPQEYEGWITKKYRRRRRRRSQRN